MTSVNEGSDSKTPLIPNSVSEFLLIYRENRSTMTQKEMGLTEKSIWDLYLKEKGPKIDYRVFFFQNLGGSVGEYERRHTLINAGSWVDPIWALLDKGFSHFPAMKLYREAKDAANPGQKLLDLIEEYNNNSYERKSHDGKVFRTQFKAKAEDPPPTNRPAKKLPSEPPISHDISPQIEDNKPELLLQNIMKSVDAFLAVSSDLPDEDDLFYIQSAKNELREHIKEGVSFFRRRISSFKHAVKHGYKKNPVSKEKFMTACEILNLKFEYGKPVDVALSKRTMFKRASALHPDKNGGSHACAIEYQSVIEAHQTIERYSEFLGVK